MLDEIEDDLPSPDMDYDYKQRVRLYKGLETPETLIDRDEIRKHVPDPMDDLRLDITTLLFGQYVYYLYHDEQKRPASAAGNPQRPLRGCLCYRQSPRRGQGARPYLNVKEGEETK